ncbi:NADP-dependent malic enzyme, partial [Fibrobacterales bacterium]|nr:NADP-dependent malic enzyme [Fibrobacterales bacterium]
MDYFKESVKLHKKFHGKWGMHSNISLEDAKDLALAYTPGVAGVCEAVAEDEKQAWDLTMKGNSVAIVSNGTAVLGLGDIGPEGALPVMEGKAILFKRFAGIDGVPLVINQKDPEKIVELVRAIAPTFGGINLEDIKAPECFYIEQALQDVGIPVFHDDQDGTAIVLLAGLLNACKVSGKKLEELNVVINGAGAAGTAIARLLRCIGQEESVCTPVKEIVVCDSKGVIGNHRTDLNDEKKKLLAWTNKTGVEGGLMDALVNADVFIGVSKGNLLTAKDIHHMNENPIIFALANPIPEILPDDAKMGGACVVATGRSDFPNQVNNALVFPGIFKGALEARASQITAEMKIAAAYAVANFLKEPTADHILPDLLEEGVAAAVAKAVKEQAYASG